MLSAIALRPSTSRWCSAVQTRRTQGQTRPEQLRRRQPECRLEAVMPAIAVIGAIAVFFLGMGLYALAAPAALVRPIGITLGESASRSEVRAVYGGFGLAIARVLGYAALPEGE